MAKMYQEAREDYEKKRSWKLSSKNKKKRKDLFYGVGIHK